MEYTLDSFEKKDRKKILALALFAGEIMLTNGAETHRVEDTIKRICISKGLHYVSSFVTPTIIMIGDDRFDGYTYIKRIANRTINFDKISLANNVSREFVENIVDIDEAFEKLRSVDSIKEYPIVYRIFFCALASSMFAYLFGGSVFDVFSSMIISICTTKIGFIFSKYEINSFISNSLLSSFIAISSLVFVKMGLGEHLDMIIAAGIMPLLPGFAITNGIRDFIAGDLISGVSRAFEALMIAISIAIAIGTVLSLYYSLGGII